MKKIKIKPIKTVNLKEISKENTQTKKMNFALQGGGAHGAFAWGVLDKILEDGRLKPDGISATSAGSMNAIALAYGYALGGREKAREILNLFWRRISEEGKKFSITHMTPLDDLYSTMGIHDTPSFKMFEKMTGMMSPYQFNPLNFNPLRNVLEEVIDFDILRTQQLIKLRLCATNVNTGKARVFTNEEMCIEAVLASGCLPFMFQTVQFKGENFWDGGYIGNPALFPLIYDTEARDILVVHINPIHRDEVPKTAGDIRNRINEISFNSSLMREMAVIDHFTTMIDEGWIKDEYKPRMRRIYMHSVRADDVMRSFGVATKLSADWEFLNNLKKLGREKAEIWLTQHFHQIGFESTVDMKTDYH